MNSRQGLTWQTGVDIPLRDSFAKNGKLLNTQDSSFRQINGNDWPVFAVSVDLGTITSIVPPVAWGIGVARDPTITIAGGGSRPDQLRTSYFWTKYSDLNTGIDTFLSDYQNAYNRSVELDRRIHSDASNVSDSYSDLVSLATRQALGSLEITTSKPISGPFNPSDIQIFVKDIGSTAQPARSNPVEVVYSAFPALLYLNASWAGYTLIPLLEYQNTNDSTFANPDLGSSFPVVLAGSSTSDTRAVDDSSSMLIMVYAHALYSGDGTLIGKYYPLLKRWGDYLTNHTLSPQNQLSDGAPADLSVNLMLKGIIGIRAMAGISQAFGDSQASQDYGDRAKDFISQWTNKSKTSDGRLMWNTNNPASWGLVYNLYADKLIRSNLVGQEMYDSQATFYSQKAKASTAPFGLPLSSDSTTARSDWTMFVAGTISDSSIRDSFISMLHARASFNRTDGAFPVSYDINSGDASTGKASPAQGAMYSLLALSLQPQSITVPPPPNVAQNGSQISSAGSDGLSGGAIAGIVISALAAVILPIVAFLLWRRRQREAESRRPERQIEPFRQFEQAPISLSMPPPPPRLGIPGTTAMSKRDIARMESAATAAPSTHRTSQLLPALSQRPTSPSEYSSSQGPSETEQLRSAVDDLRRELIWMRGYVEPPPEY